MFTFLRSPLLAFLLTSQALALPPPAQLVVPGRSLGSLHLGADIATSLPHLGPADYSDAAMQKAWATWYGQGHPPAQLDVYTALVPGRDAHKTVQVVRATSTYFRLANGLRNGSTLTQIRAAYGRLPLATTYRLPAGPRYLYDDVQRGIAFELDGPAAGSHCRALLIHLPGRAVADTYLSLPIYLKEQPPRN
jgi:hypothetical protein